MCLAAAKAIVERAEEVGINENFVIPTMEDLEMFIQTAVAVWERRQWARGYPEKILRKANWKNPEKLIKI